MSIEQKLKKPYYYNGTIDSNDSFNQRLEDEDMNYYKKENNEIYWEKSSVEEIFKEDLKEDLEDQMDDYSRE